jgi:hypothetical protein
MMVVEDVSPHPDVSFNGDLPLEIMSTHPGHDFLSTWKRPGTVRRNDRRGRKQKQRRD